MVNTTLCYIEKDSRYLMIHRVKKENDLNKDKWIGIGGKFENGENPEECVLREVLEETAHSDQGGPGREICQCQRCIPCKATCRQEDGEHWF